MIGAGEPLSSAGEALLAFEVGQAGDVLALVDEQVEGVESEVGVAAFEAGLQKLEIGFAVLAQRDRFAVDQAAGGEVRGGLDDAAELVAPVLAVAGPGGRRAAGGRQQQAVTVIFIFEQPVGAAWHGIDERRQLRGLERRWGDAGLALGAAAFLAAFVAFPDVLACGDFGHRSAGGDAGDMLLDQRLAGAG